MRTGRPGEVRDLIEARLNEPAGGLSMGIVFRIWFRAPAGGCMATAEKTMVSYDLCCRKRVPDETIDTMTSGLADYPVFDP